MQATNITVSDIRFDRSRACHRGTVAMQLSGDRGRLLVDFSCLSPQPPDYPRSLIIYDLLKDALRQVRALPVFRAEPPGIAVNVDNLRVEAA